MTFIYFVTRFQQVLQPGFPLCNHVIIKFIHKIELLFLFRTELNSLMEALGFVSGRDFRSG